MVAIKSTLPGCHCSIGAKEIQIDVTRTVKQISSKLINDLTVLKPQIQQQENIQFE